MYANVISPIIVAWRQLSHQKMKLGAAAAGVVVAVMLMLVQLGIRRGAMDNSVAFTRRINSDLVLMSPRARTIFQSSPFPRRLLYRLPGRFGVTHIESVYIAAGRWRNPWRYYEHPISLYGIEPGDSLLDLPGYNLHASELRFENRAVFDRLNRTSYGPVVETLDREGEVQAEVNGRKIHVIGTVNVGISIANDGNIYMSPANFQRYFPQRSLGAIDLGLIRLEAGVDPQEAKREIAGLLGDEVRVLTRAELTASETEFMRSTAPVDFIFGMGAAVGFFIGFVVVYQILYTEVTNHLPQLATLKAIGFTDFYLLKLVLAQAVILSVIGYVPGFFLALWLYEISTKQIQMPFVMTPERAFGVFGATLLMCCLSAAIAVRKAWTADPAEVF